MDESAGKSSGEDGPPRATSSAPSAATMAPLSVHSPGLGTRSRIPAAAQRSAASARSRELAATPPPHPGGGAALGGQRAQPRVARHPAADDQVGHPVAAAGGHGLGGQHVRD